MGDSRILRSFQDEAESKCEGFYIVVDEKVSDERLSEIIDEFLGEDWKCVRLRGNSELEYEIIKKNNNMSIGDAWDKAYDLNRSSEIIEAEPIFEMMLGESNMTTAEQCEMIKTKVPFIGEIASNLWSAFNPILDQAKDMLMDLIRRTEPDISTKNSRWVIRFLKVEDVWKKYFPDENKRPGHGIKIALPDTGYTLHPIIFDNLALADGYDFVDEDYDQHDPLDSPPEELVSNPGHGTLTASLIVADPTGEEDDEDDDFVVGIAPGSELVPLRVTSSVVLFNPANLGRAIEYAAAKGFHVISISLGCGYPSKRLLRAIRYAQNEGIIIVAAAGTNTPFVVFPAAFDDVIGVGGCTAARKMWKGSPRGASLDVTAPSEDVYIARTIVEDGEISHIVEKGSGTSVATPIVAGIAALWLSHHGWDNIAEKYGKENIPFLFKKLLCETCDKPAKWNSKIYGAGIVNAKKLLTATLPEELNKEDKPVQTQEDAAFMSIANVFGVDPKDEGKAAILKKILKRIFRTSDEELSRKLEQEGQELSFHLAANQNSIASYLSHLDSQQK